MTLRRWVLVALGVFGLAIVAAVVFVALAGWGFLREPVTRMIGEPLSRKVAINGAFDLDLGWTTRVRATDVTLGNAEWSETPQMVSIAALEVDLRPWDLLRGKIVLPRLVLEQPHIVLERNADGEANWEFSATDATAAAAEAVAPDEREEFPVIDRLDITEGTLVYRDARTGDEIEAQLGQAAGDTAESEQRITITAKGQYQKQPFSLEAVGGSILTLRESSEPYPLKLDLTAGRTRARIEGTITEPLAARGLDLRLDLRGANMADLFPLLGLTLPTTAPYTLRGHLRRSGEEWSFHDFAGKVGNSDLGGDVDVNVGGERPFMKGALVSKLLDMEDLAGFIGATPETGERKSQEQKERAKEDAAKPGVLPDRPADLEELNAMNAEVTLKAEEIRDPALPIDKLAARLSLKDGVLRLHPADFRAADGHVVLNLVLDGNKKPARTELDVQLERLALSKLLKDSPFAAESGGLVGGNAKLVGAGLSTDAILGSATGEAFLVMSGGSISALLVELAGLDIFEGLGMLVDDRPVPIRCVIADLQARDGRFTSRTLVFDTSDTKIVGDGLIDMNREQVNLLLIPQPKDFSPLTFRQPLRVRGSFKDIEVFPDPLKTDERGPLAKAANAVLTAILGLIPPIDSGVGEDSNCQALIQDARERGAAPPPGQARPGQKQQPQQGQQREQPGRR